MHLENYVLEKNIGKSCFGDVYLTSMKGDSCKRFVTKKYDREQIEGTEAIKYLKNEILNMQRLVHPNIIKFESIKKTKKNYYLIIEYCNGGELSKALEKYKVKYGKPFSQEVVQYLMRQIIDAFKYIHGKKFIHRDIKLDNIFINFESEKDKDDLNLMKAQIKITDFGFSIFIKNSALIDSLDPDSFDNPLYFEPSVLKKLKANSKKRRIEKDGRIDVWSLGTICYEMLTGKPIFDSPEIDR